MPADRIGMIRTQVHLLPRRRTRLLNWHRLGSLHLSFVLLLPLPGLILFPRLVGFLAPLHSVTLVQITPRVRLRIFSVFCGLINPPGRRYSTRGATRPAPVDDTPASTGTAVAAEPSRTTIGGTYLGSNGIHRAAAADEETAEAPDAHRIPPGWGVEDHADRWSQFRDSACVLRSTARWVEWSDGAGGGAP